MGSHWIDGEFQSDKYPTTPRGKVPLSVKDKTAQDLLWEYAQRRRTVDAEFSADLETALQAAGYVPPIRATDAEDADAIVRDLATSDPMDVTGDCTLCGAAIHMDALPHWPRCVFRRAVEWVAHPPTTNPEVSSVER